jgi:hypothetical protein
MTNSGQMLLVLGAVILFSLILLGINGSVLYSDKSMTTSKVELNAMAIAQKYMSEAATKKFDQAVYNPSLQPPIWPSLFTAPGLLGPESGEIYPNFNDVDDYNGLSIVDSTSMPSVRFTITGSVTYVNDNNPSQPVNTQTHVKKVRITVSSTFLVNPANKQPQPIYFERLYTYF